jgi:hypothetical protein
LANLTIPDRYQEGVAAIRKLNLDIVQAIRKALDRAVGPSDTTEDRIKPAIAAAAAMESVAQTSPETNFRKIAEALASMYAVRSTYEFSLPQFIDEVADALEALPNAELRLASEDKDTFKQKLLILLNADVFGIIAKVDDLRTENERIFCHGRVITDVRPIFGSNIEQGPTAALITHTLKIAFHESGRKGDHEFYVSLDAEDLQELKKVIERAEAKANSLKAILPNKLRVFGLKE